MNKLVITHLEKIIVTSDAATIMKELDIVHMVAKMQSMISEVQDSEYGDGTNLVVSFAGQPLTETEELNVWACIPMKLHWAIKRLQINSTNFYQLSQ